MGQLSDFVSLGFSWSPRLCFLICHSVRPPLPALRPAEAWAESRPTELTVGLQIKARRFPRSLLRSRSGGPLTPQCLRTWARSDRGCQSRSPLGGV